MMKLAQPRRLAVPSKRMNVRIADVRPVLEPDAELERCSGRAHELLLVDAQQLVGHTHRWNGGFPDSDGADLLRLDERDVEQLAELLRNGGRRHPTGSAAAGDDDFLHLWGTQDLLRRFGGIDVRARSAHRLRLLSNM